MTTAFSGTSNPRHRRVLALLLRGPAPRSAVDAVAGSANGPDLIGDLRAKGLSIPCQRVVALDRDGQPCRPGVYRLTSADRRKLMQWMRTESGDRGSES